MVRTVLGGFDAEFKRPSRMFFQLVESCLKTEIAKNSAGKEPVVGPSFDVFVGEHHLGGRTLEASCLFE